jgi:hypothetical protein
MLTQNRPQSGSKDWRINLCCSTAFLAVERPRFAIEILTAIFANFPEEVAIGHLPVAGPADPECWMLAGNNAGQQIQT